MPYQAFEPSGSTHSFNAFHWNNPEAHISPVRSQSKQHQRYCVWQIMAKSPPVFFRSLLMVRVHHFQGPLPHFRGYVTFCSCCSPSHSKKTDQASSDGKRSFSRTRSFNGSDPKKEFVLTAKSGSRLEAITKNHGVSKVQDTTPRTGTTAVGSVTSPWKAFRAKSLPKDTLAPHFIRGGYRASGVRGYDQCRKCGVYSVHRTGLCQTCRSPNS